MTQQHSEHGASPDARIAECQRCIANAEAYALNALEGIERRTIEHHLLWCGKCRRMIADVRRVTNLLPFLAEPAVPSPEAKSNLFARIAGSQAEDESVERPVAHAHPWETRPVAAKTPGKNGATRSSPWQRWIGPALIAPLAIALLLLSAWTNSLRNEVDSLEARQQMPANLAQIGSTDSDLQLYALKPACPECAETKASGQFGGNPDSSVGVVVAWDLDPNERHQVWCVNKQGEKFLISDLDVEHTGSVFQAVNFPDTLGGYQQIYVARHDGTADPQAELLVAMNEEFEIPSGSPTGILLE